MFKRSILSCLSNIHSISDILFSLLCLALISYTKFNFISSKYPTLLFISILLFELSMHLEMAELYYKYNEGMPVLVFLRFNTFVIFW